MQPMRLDARIGAVSGLLLLLVALELAMAEDKPPVPLNWMGHWLHEDLREKLVREVALDFAFLHPEIEINLKFPQEILGLRSKPLVAKFIAKMVQSHKIDWDVIWLDDHIYSMVAKELHDPDWGRANLVDFSQVPGFLETQKPFIESDPVYRRQTGGILVGPYIEGYYYALWVNTSLAQQLGLNIQMRGMKFDDLLGYVRQVTEYNRRNGTQIAAFYEAKDWLTLEILFQSLVKSEIPDFETAKAPVDSPKKRSALLKGLQAFEELGRLKPLVPSHGENIWFDTRQLVLENRTLFYVNGTWMYSHWRGLDPEKLKRMAPAELPVFKEVNHALGGYLPTWAVMSESPHRDEAIRLVQFWSRPAIAERWVRYTKNPTGLAGNLTDPSFSDDPYAQYADYLSTKYGSRVHYDPDSSYLFGTENTRLGPMLGERLERLLLGKTTAQRAYDELILELKP